MEPQPNYGHVCAPCWHGDLFIVGSGPSALAFDYSLVRGKRVQQEAFAKSDACRNLPAQTMDNYGKKDYK